MFFDAAKTQGAIGAVIPPKAGGGEQPGQSPHLNQKQFGPPKPGGPADAGAGAEAGGEAAAGAGAEAGGASLAELAPLLLV